MNKSDSEVGKHPSETNIEPSKDSPERIRWESNLALTRRRDDRRKVKAVILAGGLGTRLSEESSMRPKPMVEIGGMPILWHIMKLFYAQGVDDFIICAGYKQEVIKRWFAEYQLRTSDVTFEFGNDQLASFLASRVESWRVTVVDTGYATMTGGRLKRIAPLVADAPFFMTYGDGLSDIDLHALAARHRAQGRTATLTSVKATSRFGALECDDQGIVKSFREKAENDGVRINGGFMVLEPRTLDLIGGDDVVFEDEPLRKLAADGELSAYRHDGFWACMDTQRDRLMLENLWQRNEAPWKLW